ncbi:PIN domain-containing protein [Paenibacillus urinalis]|uniref:PIN domain-containing protein n=1 Tax=Paenibacillus urinalis TaxID=521520 RepID=A0AAX3N1D3_9BACL|nr:PIN domain-containing protein [Paenibacillus urinalis]WDH83327.1 PIN domain-containing protein [Paenibacillus urinalis]
MEFKSVDVSFPILEFHGVVTHFTPRKPTAFEWAILELLDRFGEHPAYRDLSLGMVFESLLSIPDPDLMIRPVLEGLVSLRIIDGPSHGISLGDVNLRDYAFTPEGRTIYRRGYVSNNEVQNEVIKCYDPLLKRFLERNEQKWLQADAAYPLGDPDELASTSLTGEVRQLVDSRSYPWKKNETEIRGIQQRQVRCMWKKVKATARLNDEGEIVFSFPQKAYEDYFRQWADPELLLEQMELWGTADLYSDELSDVSYQDLGGSLRELTPIQDNFVEDVCSRIRLSASGRSGTKGGGTVPTVHLIRPGEFVNGFAGQTIAAVTESYQKSTVPQMFVVCDPAATFQAFYNPSNRCAMLTTNEPIPVPNAYYLNNSGDQLFAANVGLTLLDEDISLPLAYSYHAQVRLPDWTPFLQHADAWLMRLLQDAGTRSELTKAVELQLIRLFWASPEDVWRSVFSRVRDMGQLDASEAAKLLESFVKHLPKVGIWKEDLFAFLMIATDRLILPGEPDREGLKAALLTLPLSFLGDDRERNRQWLELLLSRLPSPAGAEQADDILGVLFSLPINKSILRETACPSSLYSTAVATELLADALRGSDRYTGKRRTEFEAAMNELAVVTTSLEQALRLERGSLMLQYGQAAEGAYPTAALLEAGDASPKELAAKINDWHSKVDQSIARSGLPPEVFPVRAAERIANALRLITDQLERMDKKIPSQYKRVYVLDPYAFLERPKLLEDFNAEEFVVIHSRAVEELYDLLGSDRLEADMLHNLERAIRSLEETKRHNVRMEQAPVDDAKREAGSLMQGEAVLQIAADYRFHDAMLLTSDSELHKQARQIGIRAEWLKTFFQQRSERQGKQGNGKKQKKKK